MRSIIASQHLPFSSTSTALPSTTVPRVSPASVGSRLSMPTSHLILRCGSRWRRIDQITSAMTTTMVSRMPTSQRVAEDIRWRTSGWTDAHRGVLAFPDFRQQLHADAGPRRLAEVTPYRLRHVRDQLVVPAGIEGAHRFLDQRIRRPDREVYRRRVDQRPGAVVRRDR